MSELESILNYLETTSMEPHDDYTSEFSYKEQKVLWEYIKQLEWENQKLKKQLEVGKEQYNDVVEEKEKYKEIFEKVESTIEDMMYYGYSLSNGGTVTNYMATSDKSEFGSRAKVLIDILKEIK